MKCLDATACFQVGKWQFRQQMFDSQLSLSLAQGKGVGLASFFERELKRRLLPGEGTSVDDGGAAAPELRRTDITPRMPIRLASTTEISIAPQRRQDIVFDGPEKFIEAIAPLARRAAERLGIDSRVLMAQSALETGWGRAISADRHGSSHNLFNIKADSDWSGPSLSVATVEYRDGLAVREQQRFRVYSSFSESFDDYVALLNERPRYQAALASAGEPEQFLRQLQNAGYATDPHYADKVLGILDRSVLSGPEN